MGPGWLAISVLQVAFMLCRLPQKEESAWLSSHRTRAVSECLVVWLHVRVWEAIMTARSVFFKTTPFCTSNIEGEGSIISLKICFLRSYIILSDILAG